MIKKIFLSGCIFFCFLSCKVIKESPQIADVKWLLGTWENKTARGSIFETWKKVGGNELSGKSYMLKDKDTIVFENVQLVKLNNILTYIPTIQGQNNNEPVSFSLVNQNRRKVVFENKFHDFPQVISYSRISKDSLVAVVSGFDKGVAKNQVFPMQRIK